MDIHQDIIKWLRTMGYNGEIPESLIGICNNSTKFIWEDLMENVRPKQEVELIKRNIILNRLKSKHIKKQDDFAFKIREIEDFQRKFALEEKLKLLKDMVQEKHYKVEKLSKTCKIKDISIDYLKKKIKENDERKYLLELKKKQLQIQNSQAEETLTKLKNITPVEREDSNTAKEITETLQKCAEKLNQILKDSQNKMTQNIQKNTTCLSVTQVQERKNKSSVATYLSLREKEDSDEITRSCRKLRGKENFPSNIQGNPQRLDVKKRLFETPQVIVEDSEKQSFSRISFNSRKSGSVQDGAYPEDTDLDLSFKKPQKRESLGILPDSYLCHQDNDCFLQTSGIISPRKEINTMFDNSNDSVFSYMSNSEPAGVDSSDSVVFNFTKAKQEKERKIPKNVTAEEHGNKELYNDKILNKKLENLLHGNNRELIYEVLQKLIQNLKVEFTKIVSMETGVDDRRSKVNEDDVTKLRFIHLQTEIKIVQQKRVLKNLVAKVGRKKLDILSCMKSNDELTDVQEWLDIKMKQVGLDASLAAMKREIHSATNLDNDDNELQVLSLRIMKVKNEIANRISLIHLTVEDLYKAQKYITSTRESVLGPIWHIRMFKTDTEWMNPLSEDLWTEEIRVFADYPLEYQRRCTFTDSKAFYRDLCIDNFSHDAKLEPEHLQMISEILENPFSPPETILLNILKAKIKLDVLKKYLNKNRRSLYDNYSNKYSFEDLKKQESYLECSIDKLRSIMYSSNASVTLAVGDVIKKTMEIWTEMPMKEFISSERVVEGKTYKYYQNKLNSFL